jgi:threonine synthase
VTVATLAKLADRGEIRAGERVVVVITGEGLKTLDATRETFAMSEIEPALDAFEAEFPASSETLAASRQA